MAKVTAEQKQFYATADGQKELMATSVGFTANTYRRMVDTVRAGDYGADPLGDGRFRMVPSGDVVSFAERNRRLKS